MMQQDAALHTRAKFFFVLAHSRLSVKRILLLIVPLHLFLHSSAQSVTDTIYYDNYWRICEKPVARYYRLGELILTPQWHYTNNVKDFYIEGKPEMTGHYSSTGKKDGAFIFYHPNGKIKKQGGFVNDSMKGTWSYYDAKGELYFQVNCQNNQTFTPLFIKNPGGDTLLKAGTGQFAFKLLDYPDVFPTAEDYMVKGQCEKGRRTGPWTYDAFVGNDWRTVAIELYEAGTFRSGTFGYVAGGNQLRQPAFIADLSAIKLKQTEAFAHDPVFGEYTPGMHTPQVTAFLLQGEVPVFASQAKKFEANVTDYLTLCATAVGYISNTTPNLVWHNGIHSPKPNDYPWLVGYCIESNNDQIAQQSDLFPTEKLKSYGAQINFTLYEDGTPSDVAVKGNFDKDVMTHIAYYLSRLTRLAPMREGSKAVSSKQNLYLFTQINKATYRKHNYIVYRLLLSPKPQEQTTDNFNIADFANARFEDENQ